MKQEQQEKLYEEILKSQEAGSLNEESIILLKEIANKFLEIFPKISDLDREDLIIFALERCGKYVCNDIGKKYTYSYSSCYNFFSTTIKHAMFSNAKIKDIKI
jgi:hypothetical protein